jgi:CRISPR-associated endonuclease Csn1
MGSKAMETVLGIDLGTESLGWALVQPDRILAAGVRVFDAGVDDLEADGKGISRNAARREARLARRRLRRLTQRLSQLADLLASSGLLPNGNYRDSVERHQLFLSMDKGLPSPYELRARALSERLEPYALGRALYHLAQRRGFMSNRKSKQSEDEAKGKVAEHLARLREEMQTEGAPTLGALLSRSALAAQRVRGQYLGRDMTAQEFDAIWESQKRFHADLLSDALRKRVHRAIFYQRPLASVKHLVGYCELEPNRRRAPMCLFSAQRFRLWQTINNIRLLDRETGELRALTDAERRMLADKLETQQSMSYGRIKTTLKLGKSVEINLERAKQEKIPGNKTNAKLREIFGAERWDTMPDSERRQVLEDWISITKEETLARRGVVKWRLSEEAARQFATLRLDEGYSAYSRPALDKLLPHLEAGCTLPDAKQKAGYSGDGSSDPWDSLPPLAESGLPALRNPVVQRSLTELRRVVNAIVAKYGKPDRIRIELARDVRQTPKQREETHKRQNKNRKAREKAAKWLEEQGYVPNGRNIEKYLLWEECGQQCPYTGKMISAADLFGDQPQFDIEHITPLPRSLDDSFMNKTLCDVRENRERKHNRTPFEAYSGTPRWDDILRRAAKLSYAKARRFRMNEAETARLLDAFTARQLNDTGWASRWAKKYLGLLYGGLNDDGIDAFGTRRVFASSGGVTAMLRHEWGLDSILGDGSGKSRDDHRHHTVDAIVVALTNDGRIKALADAARRGLEVGRRFAPLTSPWDTLRADVAKTLEAIVVSHRSSRRVRGPLHAATFYSPQGNGTVHIRKPLASLDAKKVSAIVDPAIRAAVAAKLAELGKDSPKDAFKDNENLPLDPAGRPIRHVRIEDKLTVYKIGDGHRVRWAETERNHHMAVYASIEDKTWKSEIVSLLEAHRRKRAGEPIIRTDFGPGTEFLFTLSGGELIELDNPDGKRTVYRIRTISDRLLFFRASDARPKKRIKEEDTLSGLTANADTLRKRRCRKVAVTPLGELKYVSD